MSRLPYYGPPDANQFLLARRVTDTDSGQPADIQQVDDALAQDRLRVLLERVGVPANATQTLVSLLMAIRDNTDTLEVNTDSLESLVGGTTAAVNDSSAAIVSAVGSASDEAVKGAVEAAHAAIVSAIGSATDEVVAGEVTGLRADIAAEDFATAASQAEQIARMVEIRDFVDGLETLVSATNARLDTLNSRDFASAARQDTQIARLDTLLARTGELTLTGRLLEKRPAAGYRLWLHDNATTNLGVGTILSEAPTGSNSAESTSTAWRGIFVPQAGGQITERNGFAWASRLTGWAVE